MWEIIGQADGGLSVLRTFRLLRVLKLVRFMPALRRQLVVLMKTMDNVATFCMLLMLFIFIFRCVRRALPRVAARGRPVARSPHGRWTGGPAPSRARPLRRPWLRGLGCPEPQRGRQIQLLWVLLPGASTQWGTWNCAQEPRAKGAEEGGAGRQPGAPGPLLLSLIPGLGEGSGAESSPHRPGETDTQSWPLPEARVASRVSRVLGFGLTTYRMETVWPWTLGSPAHKEARVQEGVEEWMVGVG